MLNQRKAANKLTKLMLTLLIPIGLGLAATNSQPQLKDAAAQLGQRLRRPSSLLPEQLRSGESTGQQSIEQHSKQPLQDEKQPAAKKKFGSWF